MSLWRLWYKGHYNPGEQTPRQDLNPHAQRSKRCRHPLAHRGLVQAQLVTS